MFLFGHLSHLRILVIYDRNSICICGNVCLSDISQFFSQFQQFPPNQQSQLYEFSLSLGLTEQGTFNAHVNQAQIVTLLHTHLLLMKTTLEDCRGG